MHWCQNNSEKPYTEKKTKPRSSVYSLFTNCIFDSAENKLDCCKREDCVEILCKDLREHAMKIIKCEKKEMIPQTDEENYEDLTKSKKSTTYVKKNLVMTTMMMMMMIIKSIKKRDHCHYTENLRGSAHNICNLRSKQENKFL